MLSILLPLTFILICLDRLGAHERDPLDQRPWQGDVLLAAAFFGVIALGIIEGLSAFSMINRAWVTALWIIVLLGIAIKGWFSGSFIHGWRKVRRGIASLRGIDILFLIPVGIILALLFAVAVVSPQNNVDVMQYHMPRVLNWIQNQSLQHFPAIYTSQNARPYWAEVAILNLRVLSGTDQSASFLQWFSLLGSMIGAAGIASLLGGRRSAQWLTALFVLSIPMSLLQATTAKNDIVSTFWVISLAYLIVVSMKRELTRLEFVGMSLSFALGILTKGTVFPFVGPLLVWYFLTRLRTHGFRRTFFEGLVLVLIAAALNGVFWYRNVVTFGGPYGSSIPVRISDASLGRDDGICASPIAFSECTSPAQGMLGLNPLIGSTEVIRPLGVSQLGASGFITTIGEQLSTMARMVAMHFVSPFHWFNQHFFNALSLFPTIFPSSFIDMLENSVWNYAMTAGNPLHFLLAFGSIIGAWFLAVRKQEKILGAFSIVPVSGFFLISFAGCADWTVCGRYQLAFFVLATPIVGVVVSMLGKKFPRVVAILLLLYALPYVLINQMRPVIGYTPWPTRIESVFSAEPSEILFAQIPGFRDEYEAIAQSIQDAGCKRVALSTAERDFEYTFWWLLDAPQSGIQFQHERTTPSSAKYIDPGFGACALICTECELKGDYFDSWDTVDYGHVSLFLKPED